MTTITETFHNAAGALTTAHVYVWAYDYRSADDGHMITPEPIKFPITAGAFECEVEPGPTVFEIHLPGLPARLRIVDVPDSGTHELSDLAELADPGTVNFAQSVRAALGGLTWEAFA